MDANSPELTLADNDDVISSYNVFGLDKYFENAETSGTLNNNSMSSIKDGSPARNILFCAETGVIPIKTIAETGSAAASATAQMVALMLELSK